MKEHKNKTILIVEDDKNTNLALMHVLEREGFDVLSASDGEEGLKLAIGKHPDLILLDLLMPKMDGRQMLGNLREDNDGRNIPVIVLTNADQMDDISEMMEGGVTHYFLKANVRTPDLLTTIRSLLDPKSK